MLPTALSVVASIPSPDVSYFELGPLRIHFYAFCLIAGIVIAAIITHVRLTKRGAEPWVVLDIALPAVVLGIIVARFYHVFTHFDFYFGQGREWWNPFVRDAIWNVWDGGIAIYGALIGGAIGAWLGCKWTGIRFTAFADALAPGLIIAQAVGRLGNWFNQELFGQPTTLPWGLEISPDNAAFPPGLPEDTLFHPTFLYESLWNLLGAAVLFWLGRKATMQWGRLFAVYLIWYGAGRIVWESIRIDPSDYFFGVRTNVWAALIGVLLGIVILIVQARRHKGLEPSVYVPGREWRASGSAVESQDAPEYVDVSAPPASTDQRSPAATS